MTEAELELKKKLEKDLFQISRLSGRYTMSNNCRKKWIDWYNNLDEEDARNRICTDRSFSGWYSRKPTYIVKVALLCAAAESNELIVHWRHIEKAIIEIEKVEYIMGNAFKAIGRSEISAEVDTVLQIIVAYQWISEKQLMTTIWRDVDAGKFDTVINTLIKSGKVRREFQGPNGEKGIWYCATKAAKQSSS